MHIFIKDTKKMQTFGSWNGRNFKLYV